MHPFLKDPEKARAYALLVAQPSGSLRTWADSLSWSLGKLQRFLKAVSKAGLGETELEYRGLRRCLRFVPLDCIALHRPEKRTPDAVLSKPQPVRELRLHRPKKRTMRCDAVQPSITRARGGLTTTAGLKAFSPKDLTRNRAVVVNPGRGRLKTRLRESERQEGTAELVAAMNEILCRNHPLDFLPVDVEQPGSHHAARHWLVELGISLEDALKILRGKCALFNPHKINGDMPRSIGFFTRSVDAEWRRVLRDRAQLKLFPQMEMHVEKPAPGRAKRPPSKPESLGSILTKHVTKQIAETRCQR